MADMTREQMRDRLGNLEQIRELLFGQRIREYDQFFEQYERRLKSLESEFSGFQEEVRDRISELRESLEEKISSSVDSLEKKLKYLNVNTQQAVHQIRQDLDFLEERAGERNNSLQKLLLEKNTNLEGEIIEARNQLQGSIQELKDQIFEIIDREFSQIKDGKLSRADLAEVLFELCLKVKGSEFVPELTGARDNGPLPEEFLLPEQQPTEATNAN